MELSLENLSTHDLLCLGLKGLILPTLNMDWCCYSPGVDIPLFLRDTEQYIRLIIDKILNIIKNYIQNYSWQSSIGAWNDFQHLLDIQVLGSTWSVSAQCSAMLYILVTSHWENTEVNQKQWVLSLGFKF